MPEGLEWEELDPRVGDHSSQPLLRQELVSTPHPLRGSGVTVTVTPPPRTVAVQPSLQHDLLTPITGNITGLYKARERLWGKLGQLHSSSVVAATALL